MLSGKTITIRAHGTDTVYEIKREIQARSEIPAGEQRLIFSGQQLENNRALGTIAGLLGTDTPHSTCPVCRTAVDSMIRIYF